MKSTLGRQIIKDADVTEGSSLSELAVYGLSLDKNSPPSEALVSKFCEIADTFTSALGISPLLVGNGASLSYSEGSVGAELDREGNRVKILINDRINLVSFSILWDSMLNRFGLLKSFNDATFKMVQRKLDKDEVKTLLVNKWHLSEKMLVDAVNVVYENLKHETGDRLTEAKLTDLKANLYKLLASEEYGSQPNDVDSSLLLSAVSKKVFDISGVNLTESDIGLLYSLMGIRADSLAKIQASKDDSKDVFVPFKFYERVSALSSDRNTEFIVHSPGIALAAYVCHRVGIDISTLLTELELDLIPTSDELIEMSSGIEEFSELISMENYSPKTKSSKRAYN